MTLMSMVSRISFLVLATLIFVVFGPAAAWATPFTTTIPDGLGSQIPNTYPEAGGTVFVLVGANGNYYYQFVNPSTQFRGFEQTGTPAAFRGSPFQLGPTQNLNCGPTACSTYFGGSITKMYVRLTARDGDACAGNFDHNDITFRVNGFDVSSFTGVNGENTNLTGTVSQGATTCFGNQGSTQTTTAWFESTDAALLNDILTVGSTTPTIKDDDGSATRGDNFWYFTDGNDATGSPEVAPGVTIVKDADVPSYSAVGDIINYTFEVENIGSVTLNNVVVTDPFIVGAVSCPTTTLISAQAMTCTAQHTVTQANIDNDIVFVNQATVTAVPTEGSLGNVSGTISIPGPAANNVMTLTKVASKTVDAVVGDVITYEYEVMNDGNITLDDVSVSDVHGGSGVLSAITPASVILAPGASQTFTATYTITQADVDSQVDVSNTATASATPRRGTIVEPTATEDVSVIAAVRDLVLDKTTTSTDFDTVGDILNYSYDVTNNGNVSIVAPITVADDQVDGAGGSVSCPALPAAGLAPGDTLTCTATYAVTQADLDAGSVTNVASATDGTTTSNTDSETVTGTAIAGLTLDKRLTAASPTSYAADGITLLYEYEVTNTGNQTIETPITVADDVIDAVPSSVSCPALPVSAAYPAGGLLPGDSLTCTASYTTVQGDVDTGSVVNTATATDGTTTSSSDAVTVNAVQDPSLALVKTAVPIDPADFVTGAVVTYDYVITNDGNTTVPGPFSINDNVITSGITCDAVAAPGLAPTGTVNCQGTYTVTTNDVDLGSVTNNATGTNGTITSPSATETVPTGASPALSIVKTSPTPSFATVGDVVTFDFEVTNSGNAAFTRDIVVTDDKISTSPLTCWVPTGADPDFRPASSDGSIPAETVTCSGTYTVTQADLDADEVVNEASASTIFQTTTTVTSPVGTATVPAASNPAMEVTKSASPSPFATLGEAITYTISVRNSGNQTLSNIAVTDPLIPTLSCVIPTLAVGATDTSCVGTYNVTQADMDAGQIVNTATATGSDPQGGPVTDDGGASPANDDPLITPATPANPLWELTKTSTSTVMAKDDVVTYSFELANTGNVTITTAALADGQCDAAPTLTGGDLAPTGQLNVGEIWTYTCDHTVTQLEVDTGTVDNTATATGTAARGTLDPVDAIFNIAITAAPAMTLSKSASKDTDAVLNDVITYTYEAVNTGNVTLNSVTISDVHSGTGSLSAITPASVSLAPGDSQTFTATYTINQDDVDAGTPITNTATANSVPARGTLTPPTANEEVTIDAANNVMTLTKVASKTVDAVVGDVITYEYEVMNDGNITLDDVSVSDVHGGSGALSAITPASVTLAPGASQTFTATYTITQADVDGQVDVSNTATASATPRRGTIVEPTATEDVSVIAAVRDLVLDKTTTSTDFDTVGDILNYSYDVTNNGNVSIVAPITVADDQVDGAGGSVSCPALPAAGLAPGDTLTCTATYAVTQADLDAGSVTNVASATDGTTTSNTDSETVTGTAIAGLTLDKRLTAASPTSYAADGITLLYEYEVTNTGNQTIETPITVADDVIDAVPSSVSCPALPVSAAYPAGGLLPGDSLTCTASYTTVQGDVDTGSVVNTATATDGTTTSSSDAVTVNAVQDPSLALVKTAVPIDPADFVTGAVVTYDYVITNDGNTTVPGPFSINDNVITSGITCDAVAAPGLAPTGTVNCQGTYTVTTNDVDLGSVTNNATGTNGTITSPSATETVPTGASPALSIVKTSPTPSFATVGDVVTFDFEVTNSGNAAFTRDIVVTDDKISTSPLTCWVPTGADPDFRPASSDGSIPAETVTCSGTYTVTQADLDADEVVNEASASTIFQTTTTVTSPVGTATVPAASNPAMEVTKSASPSPFATLGEAITYTISVRNSGNQTLSNIAVTDPLIPTLSCVIPTLAVGATDTSCVGTYNVTQADMDAGQIVNTATATGSDPQGGPVTDDGGASPANDDPLITPATPANPLWELTKTSTFVSGASGDPTQKDDIITYTFALANTGNVTITTAALADGQCIAPPTLTGGDFAPVGELNVGETWAYTCDHSVIQPEIDAGTVDNTATATGTAARGTLAPVDAIFDIPLVQEPSIEVIKVADTSGLSSPVREGDQISYIFFVQNTGNVTLTDVVVTDPDAVMSGSTITLAPDEQDTTTFTAVHTLTQLEIDSGAFTNQATATGTPPNGPPVTDLSDDTSKPGSDDPTVVPFTSEPGLQLLKSASVNDGGDGRVDAGDTIEYVFTVRNTGNTTVSNISITDASATVTGGPISLAPGISDNTTFKGTHVLTQAEIDSGSFENTATVSGQDPSGTPVTDVSDSANPSDGVGDDDPTVTPLGSDSSIAVEKSATLNDGGDGVQPGDTIEYTFVVTNTGNTTLSNISINDPKVTVSGGPIASLIPGADNTSTFTASYTLTQTDIDAGTFENTATVNGTDPSGALVTDASDDPSNGADVDPNGDGNPDDPTVLSIPQTPSIEVIKSGTLDDGGDGVADEGDAIDYVFTVTNTGNVTVSGITIADANPAVVMSGGPVTLAPTVSDTTTFTGRYVLTQPDIDAGSFTNTATATGSDPAGNPVSDVSDNPNPAEPGDDDPTVTPLGSSPSIEVTKTSDVSGLSSPAVPGDLIAYTFTVTNTGNVTLSNVVVSDTGATVTGGPIVSLAPGVTDTTSFEASYAITQDDIDAGTYANQADVTGNPPTGPPATATSDDPTTPADGDPTVATIPQTPSMEVVKTATSVNFTTPGDTSDFDYVVTNTGNTRLTGPITVTDNLIPSVSCPAVAAPGLAPSASITCTGTYFVTQADLDNGSVTNIASGSSPIPGGGTITSPITSETIPAVSNPALTIAKSSTDTSYAAVGDVLNYTFVLTNNGNLTLTGTTEVVDDRIGTIDCFTGNFAPGTSQTCTAPYTVTQADIDAGSVTNQAYGQNGTVVSPPMDVTIDADQAPALTVDKTSTDTAYAAVGDVLTYSYLVTNSGNTTLTTPISIADDKIDGAGGSVSCPALPANGLAPNGTITCTGTYSVTQADLNTGNVTNIASASVTNPDGTTTTSPTDSVIIDATQLPELTVIKSGTLDDGGDGVADEGDAIDYVFTVTNTGNVTVSGITIADANPAVVMSGGPVTLAPTVSDTTTFTGRYVLTQPDIDAGSFTNTATATGSDPAGNPVSDVSDNPNPAEPGDDDPTVTPLGSSPSIEVTKTSDVSGLSSPAVPGDLIAYTFTVTNTGNVTLSNVVVSDTGATVTGGPIVSLAPGVTDTTSFEASYAITQDDIDAGTYANQADVTGNPPTGPPATATSDDPTTPADGDPTVATIPQTPSMEVVKTATSVNFTTPGDTSDFDYVVTNTGNTRLTGPITVTDNLIPSVSCPAVAAPGLAPSASITCTGTYFVTQADLDNGSVTNIASGSSPIPGGGTITSPITSETIPAVSNPALTIAKSSTDTSYAAVGDVLNYTFVLTNNGNLTLTGTTEVVDDRIGTIDCFTGNFAPGTSQTCTAPYTVTQADIDAGSVTNQAYGQNGTVVSPPMDVTIDADQAPALTVDKTSTDTAYAAVGDVLTYSYLVTNSGNTTLTTPISIADDKIDGAGGSVSCPALPANGLAPNGTITCTGTYSVTQADLNTGNVTNIASASVTNPDGTTTTSPTDSVIIDATQLPELTVIKSGTLDDGGDGVADEGDAIDYVFTVTNTGNVTVSGITIADANPAVVMSGGPVTLAPTVSDTTTFTGRYVLTQPDIDAGSFTNTATATGSDPAGNPVSDVSDNPNPAEPGDDDPTVTPLGSSPSIEVTKTSDVSGLSSPAVPGDLIAYTFTVTNTGNVTLSNVVVSDTGATVTGGPIVSLAPGVTDTTSFEASYAITQDDIDAGTYANQADVTGNPPTGPPATATSDDPTTPADGDPTVATIPQTPALELTKEITAVTQLFPYVYEVIYTVNITNTGNSTANGVSVLDDLAAAFTPGTLTNVPTLAISGFGGSAAANAAFDGVNVTETLSGNPILAPAQTGTVVITSRVSFASGYPSQGNTAYGASDEVPTPVPSDDISVTPGDDGDTNPTPAPVADADNDGAPDNEESATNDRDGDGVPDAQDYDPTGYFYCEETGAIQTGGLISVTGPFGTQIGIGTSNNITIVRDGSTGEFQFHVSAPGQYTLSYVLPTTGVASTDRLSSGAVDLTTFLPANPAVLGGGQIGSTGVLNDFTAPANPFYTVFNVEAGDPNLFNNNIPMKFCGAPQVTASKSIVGTPTLLANGDTEVTFRVSVENTGSTRVNDVRLVDDLDAAFGAGNYSVGNMSMFAAANGAGLGPNTSFNGNTNANALANGAMLEPGGTVNVDLTVSVAAAASGTFTNTVTAQGVSPLDGTAITPDQASVNVAITAANDLDALRVEKVTISPTARLGDVIPYTINVTNPAGLDRTGVSLVDLIPAGFTYRPGTASIDGVTVEPVQNGRRLVWANRTIAAGATSTLTLNLGVGAAAVGTEFVNQAWVEDPLTGGRISNIGKATVRREVEHVFDCGEIIGKVFDDKNRDGYQNKGEPGLPGVRIATVKGLLVTSDKHGRFHVACADLPDERIGSNFIMKVDTRTLPSGYRLTTENPRVVRLTRGKITKLNFGASITKVVRIDLNAAAFVGTGSKPVAQLDRGVDKLIKALANKRPSTIRLTYHSGKRDRSLAARRLKAVSQLMRKRWKRARGGYRLDIETRILGGR